MIRFLYSVESALLTFVEQVIPKPWSNRLLHLIAGFLIGMCAGVTGRWYLSLGVASVLAVLKEYMDGRTGLGSVNYVTAVCTALGGGIAAYWVSLP